MIDTAHLDTIIESYEPGGDLFDVARRLTLAHAAHLGALGPVRVLTLDPCPRCSGRVLAGDATAKCAAGCGWEPSR